MPNKKLLLDMYRTQPDSTATREGLFPEMMKSLGSLIVYLHEAPLRRTIPLVLWNEFWLERANTPENHTRYKRGRVVYVDLGAFNIGSETSYRHPCLLLYEGRNWALIAPMTSKKYGDPIPLHYDLSSDYPFDSPTTLQLDAIKVIDKRRILGYFLTRTLHEQVNAQTRENVEWDDLEPIVLSRQDLDTIDELLAAYYAPGLYKQVLHQRFQLQQAEKEKLRLRQELAQLRQELQTRAAWEELERSPARYTEPALCGRA
ncbi:MAG TPA: type II toxin-antitoxin system PemK/MazF family toxin [Bacilli bacterium]|nr:type II toxin-antitoxin system PemK/MazF family toxin [Bacilli bacterium]